MRKIISIENCVILLVEITANTGTKQIALNVTGSRFNSQTIPEKNRNRFYLLRVIYIFCYYYFFFLEKNGHMNWIINSFKLRWYIDSIRVNFNKFRKIVYEPSWSDSIKRRRLGIALSDQLDFQLYSKDIQMEKNNCFRCKFMNKHLKKKACDESRALRV